MIIMMMMMMMMIMIVDIMIYVVSVFRRTHNICYLLDFRFEAL